MDAFSLGIIFALISMFGFGTYQFFINKSVKNINIYSSLIYVYSFFILSASPLLFFYRFVIPDVQTSLLILLASFIGVINIPFLYNAIKKGKISLIIPIANTYSLFVVIFSYVFFGESLTFSKYLFGLLILLGMILIVTKRDNLKNIKIDKKDIKPIIYALIFSCGLGLYSIILKPIEKSIGPIYGTFYTELFILIFLGSYYPFSKVRLQKPKNNVWKFLFFAGFFQAIGALFFLFGIRYSNVNITSIIGTTNPLVTLMLAFVFLKERIEWNQLIGIIITIIGLIGLAL